MPKIHANSDDLRKFSHDLKKFTRELGGLKSNIESKFRQMDWDDEVFRKFEAEFNTTMLTLKKFLDHVPEHMQILEKKARQLEDFQH